MKFTRTGTDSDTNLASVTIKWDGTDLDFSTEVGKSNSGRSEIIHYKVHYGEVRKNSGGNLIYSEVVPPDSDYKDRIVLHDPDSVD